MVMNNYVTFCCR